MRRAVLVIGIAACFAAGMLPAAQESRNNAVPQFGYQPLWPKPLPHAWMLGWVGGLAVDTNDHVWINSVGSSLTNYENLAASNPPKALCCKPAPPVIEFDQGGNIVRSWGGPGVGYDWPSTEHGLAIDHKGYI